MQGHGYGGNHDVALVDDTEECTVGVDAGIGCTSLFGDGCVSGVLGGTSKQHGIHAAALQTLDQRYPMLNGPLAGTPAVTAAGVQSNNRTGIFRNGQGRIRRCVHHVFLSVPRQTTDRKDLFGIRQGVGLVHVIEESRDELGHGPVVDRCGNAVLPGIANLRMCLD